MPATSERQKRAACFALSIKRGETPRSEVTSEEILNMADSMTEEELKEYCQAPVKKE